MIAIENVGCSTRCRRAPRELGQSVDELRALGEVSQAVTLLADLETVLNTIVSKATQLSGTDAGAIYVYDEAAQDFHLRATYGMDPAIIAEIKDRRIHIGETAIGEAVEQRIPLQIPDIHELPQFARPRYHRPCRISWPTDTAVVKRRSYDRCTRRPTQATWRFLEAHCRSASDICSTIGTGDS